MASNRRFSTVVILNDAAIRARRWVLKAGFAAIYVHLDDFGFLGGDLDFVKDLRAAVRRELELLNFDVTDEEPEENHRYIGYDPQRYPPRWNPDPAKVGELSRLLDEILMHGRVATDIVHTGLAVYIWLALLWRPALSVASMVAG